MFTASLLPAPAEAAMVSDKNFRFLTNAGDWPVQHRHHGRDPLTPPRLHPHAHPLGVVKVGNGGRVGRVVRVENGGQVGDVDPSFSKICVNCTNLAGQDGLQPALHRPGSDIATQTGQIPHLRRGTASSSAHPQQRVFHICRVRGRDGDAPPCRGSQGGLRRTSDRLGYPVTTSTWE